MRKSIFLVFMMFAFALSIQANENKKIKENNNVIALSGTLIDADSNELLTGVAVRIEGANQIVYTDFDGNFSFENLKPGNYIISAEYVSYKKHVKQIALTPSDSHYTIKLKSLK